MDTRYFESLSAVAAQRAAQRCRVHVADVVQWLHYSLAALESGGQREEQRCPRERDAAQRRATPERPFRLNWRCV